MAASILDQITTDTRYVDLDGPNMRGGYFAKRRTQL